MYRFADFVYRLIVSYIICTEKSKTANKKRRSFERLSFIFWWERMDIASRGLKTVHRTVFLTPCSNPRCTCGTAAPTAKNGNIMQTKKVLNTIQNLLCLFGGSGWIRTIEVTDNRFTVCPLWPLGNTPTKKWSWWTDLNPRPADYKSAALPTELHQLMLFNFCAIP